MRGQGLISTSNQRRNIQVDLYLQLWLIFNQKIVYFYASLTMWNGFKQSIKTNYLPPDCFNRLSCVLNKRMNSLSFVLGNKLFSSSDCVSGLL